MSNNEKEPADEAGLKEHVIKSHFLSIDTITPPIRKKFPNFAVNLRLTKKPAGEGALLVDAAILAVNPMPFLEAGIKK